MDKLDKLMSGGYDIDQRCHHKFEGNDDFGARKFYKQECGQATR